MPPSGSGKVALHVTCVLLLDTVLIGSYRLGSSLSCLRMSASAHPYLLLRSPRVIRFPDFVASFDHFVGDQQQVVVDFQIEQSGRLEVDD